MTKIIVPKGQPYKDVTVRMTKMGICPGTSVSAYPVGAWPTWEYEMGEKVDFLAQFRGDKSWSDTESTVGSTTFNQNGANTMDWHWTAYFMCVDGSLAKAAANDATYIPHWRTIASRIISAHPKKTGDIWVRLNQEQNGNWFAWQNSSSTVSKNYAAGWRNAVDTFRTVLGGERLKFTFCPSCAYASNWTFKDGYPGDDFVDAIGGDDYYNPTYDGNDPAAAFTARRTSPHWGLDVMRNTAAIHNKQCGLDEWGVRDAATNTISAAPYVEKMADWIVSTKLDYHAYWENNSAFKGQLMKMQYAEAAAMYKTKFRGGNGRAVISVT